MSDPNPYESPERESHRTPQNQYEKPRDKWLGILSIFGGIALLLFTAYFVFISGVLICWTLGGGIGLLGVGVFFLKSYFDDRRYSRLVDDMSEN